MFDFPNENMSIAEKYIWLKALEKEVKNAISILQMEVKDELENYDNKLCKNEHGNVQKIKKVTTKPKESLQLFLLDLGLLDICKQDGIDMQKVKQLVEAGVIEEEELQEHLEKTESEYLKFNGKKK